MDGGAYDHDSRLAPHCRKGRGPSAQEAAEKLDSAQGEAVLDFSSVGRIDSGALRALEEFVDAAGQKSVKVVVRGASVGVYKMPKLAKLESRFSFAS